MQFDLQQGPVFVLTVWCAYPTIPGLEVSVGDKVQSEILLGCGLPAELLPPNVRVRISDAIAIIPQGSTTHSKYGQYDYEQ